MARNSSPPTTTGRIVRAARRRRAHGLARPAVTTDAGSGSGSPGRPSAARTAAAAVASSGPARSSRRRGRASAGTTTAATRPGRGDSTTTRSASSTASEMLWVTTTTVVGGLRPEAEQLDVEALPGQRVERAERLVEEEHRRAQGERPRERHALAHPARQAVGTRGREPVEPDQPQELVRPRLALGRGPAGQLERVGDVRERVTPRQETRLLEHEADGGIRSADGPALDLDRSRVGGEQPAGDPQEGALAASVGADDRDDFARGDLEVEPVEGEERRPVGGAERAPDAGQVDRRRALR